MLIDYTESTFLTEMISRAKKRLDNHKNTIFMATDGIHFPLESESVDVIFPLLFFNICQALMLSAGTSRRFHVY